MDKDNKINPKQIKKIAKLNLRKKENQINEKMEYEIALASGKSKDRLNKILNRFSFGSIDEDEKNIQVEENNNLFLKTKQEIIDSYSDDFKRAEEEYNLFLENPNLDEIKQHSFFVKFKNVLRQIGLFFKKPTFLYILKRLGLSIITLLLIITFVIILIRFIPDDKFYDVQLYQKLLGQSGKEIADNFKNISLYQAGRVRIDGTRISLIESIFKYIYNILPIPKKIPVAWDLTYTQPIEYWSGLIYLGKSQIYSEYVSVLLRSRIGISFAISIITLIFTYLIGYPLGIAMSKKPGGIIDKIGNAFIVLNYAIPALVFFLIMNKVLGSPNGIFKKLDFGFAYEKGKLHTLVPPIFTVVFLSIPGVSIWVRRYMVDELNSDYVKFARAKGLSENKIMYTHVLKNAIIPLIRNIPASFILAIVGSYFVEYIWAIPGTGGILIKALNGAVPDIDVIVGLTMVYSSLGMLAFLLGDVATALYDPRIKLAGKRG